MNASAVHDTPRWLEPWSLDEGDDRVRALFAESFGGEPDAVASAPGRLTIIGEHTDYSDCRTLATVTTHRTFVAVRRREDEAIRVVSAQGEEFDGPGARWEGAISALSPGDQTWPARVAGVVWALAERGYPVTGIDVAIDSCLPPDSGLASSAALATAAGKACAEAWGLALDTEDGVIELAEACWEAEHTYIGMPVGRLDTHTILRCRDGGAALLDFAPHPPRVTHYPLYFPDYGLRLLVVVVGARHPSWRTRFARRHNAAGRAARALGATTLREVADSEDGLARAAALENPMLRSRAVHVLAENERVSATLAELSGLGPAHDRFMQIGTLMLESHRSLSTDYAVSTDEQDLAVDTAFAAGALGARMSGAGFGGCVVALVRGTSAQEVADQIDATFVSRGLARPTFLMV